MNQNKPAIAPFFALAGSFSKKNAQKSFEVMRADESSQNSIFTSMTCSESLFFHIKALLWSLASLH